MSARELRVTGGRTEATKNDVACIRAMINFTTGFEIKFNLPISIILRHFSEQIRP